MLKKLEKPARQKVNVVNHHPIRPLCPCCGGGEPRPGYTMSKAASRHKSSKARRGKAKHKNHRR